MNAVNLTTTSVSICPSQLPYTWNSHIINSAGIYADTLVGTSGCDSVSILVLTVKAVSSSTTNITVCPAQLPYNWNGNSYNTGGTYNVTLINNAGCDSIATLNLAVNAVSLTTTSVSICPSQLPYTWNSQVINSAGTYADTLVGSSGCDSISTLILIVKATSASITDITLCPAQLPYNWNGNSYNTGGTYNVTLINNAGCDSIATLNLAVNAVNLTTTSVSICPSQLPYTWNSQSINAAGTYVDTLIGSSGCDSISTLILTVKATSASITDITVCPAQLPYSWNGNSYNTGGTYNVTLINNAGCDSIATLNLAVNAVSLTTTNVSICPSQLPYTWNSHTINAAGTYSDTLVGSSGCDSVSTLILTVKAVSSSTTNITVCLRNCLTTGMAIVTMPAALLM
ncbi:MAG: hypothetical protein IPP72_22455 [Chitinophagaceae bacterium]|nr:hypothetical protein [Chitinophagaceae bacterium]